MVSAPNICGTAFSIAAMILSTAKIREFVEFARIITWLILQIKRSITRVLMAHAETQSFSTKKRSSFVGFLRICREPLRLCVRFSESQ
jgi:hypothetical protein